MKLARSLILILSLALASCQTATQRLDTAAAVIGQTKAQIPPVALPDACTSHIERVTPKVGEKARWTQKRWEFVADNRDQQADDCRKWEADYNSKNSTPR